MTIRKGDIHFGIVVQFSTRSVNITYHKYIPKEYYDSFQCHGNMFMWDGKGNGCC